MEIRTSGVEQADCPARRLSHLWDKGRRQDAGWSNHDRRDPEVMLVEVWDCVGEVGSPEPTIRSSLFRRNHLQLPHTDALVGVIKELHDRIHLVFDLLKRYLNKRRFEFVC